MIVAVTGHRPEALGWTYNLKDARWQYLYTLLHNTLVRYDATHCISGMALGVDTVFAFASLNYRDKFPDKKIIVECAIPCYDYPKFWKPASKKHYYYILGRANIVTEVSNDPYRAELMQIRNEYMVDKADKIIAVWNGNTRGGTYNCVRYAEHVGKPIEVINPLEITLDKIGQM